MAHVLIVDDVEVTRYTLTVVLDELGHSYAEAKDPERARTALRQGRYDGVLLDWHLKKESGLDLIDEIKRAKPAPKIVVISGVEGSEQAGTAQQAGAHAFLAKPLTHDNVAQALNRAGLR